MSFAKWANTEARGRRTGHAHGEPTGGSARAGGGWGWFTSGNPVDIGAGRYGHHKKAQYRPGRNATTRIVRTPAQRAAAKAAAHLKAHNTASAHAKAKLAASRAARKAKAHATAEASVARKRAARKAARARKKAAGG